MRSLNENDLICQLQVDLNERFRDEEFPVAELEGVFQALVNSIGWAALNRSRENDWEPVAKLETDDHFSDEYMNRHQILRRIENTSGLNPEMSNYALNVIEQRIDREVADNKAVEIEHIGVIEVTSPPHYVIHLHDGLKVGVEDRDRTEEDRVIVSVSG